MSKMILSASRVFGLVAVLVSLSGVCRAGGPPVGAPEIDPGSMASALTLLSGGMLLLAGRRRRD